MRERLVAAFVGLTLAILLVFTVNRGYQVDDLVESQELTTLGQSADLIAALVDERESSGSGVTAVFLAGFLQPGNHVAYTDADGGTVESDAHLEESEGHDSDDLVATAPTDDGGSVTLTRHSEVVDGEVSDEMLRLALLGLGLAVLAALAALLGANRLSRPFRELADAAAEIGRGRFDTTIRRYGVPEAEAIGSALRRSAKDLEAMLRREREFAARASHELRTPITALKLELEDLALSPDLPSSVAGRLTRPLGELDRLSATVSDILGADKQDRNASAEDIDLAALVRDGLERWRRRMPDRSFVVDAAEVVPVHLPAIPLTQLLDILVGRSVAHGAGTVTITLVHTGEYAELRVAGQGHRLEETTAPGAGTGPAGWGLPLAGEVAESVGGLLRLTDESETTFSLLLPTARVPAATTQAN